MHYFLTRSVFDNKLLVHPHLFGVSASYLPAKKLGPAKFMDWSSGREMVVFSVLDAMYDVGGSLGCNV